MVPPSTPRALAALLALPLAAVPATAETMRVSVGDTEIAAERLGTVGPVTIFESGLGESMAGWAEVADALSACMRVVLYDRPGIGASEPRGRGGDSRMRPVRCPGGVMSAVVRLCFLG